MYSYTLDKCLLLVMVTILCVADNYVNGNEFSREDDKVVLSPAELVDMVWQEQRQGKSFSEQNKIAKHSVLDDLDSGDFEKDEARLNARKVWSRWSKWSKCSATCGGGQLMRRRLCVAGRCAPGEREEQHRTCVLPPCARSTRFSAASDVTVSSDESHDETE